MKLSRYQGYNLIAIDGVDGTSRTSSAEQNQITPTAAVPQEITLETVARILIELQTSVNRLEVSVNRLEVETLGTAGKEASGKFTIRLFVLEDDIIEDTLNEVIYGHGILLRCRGENEFAILTAGHVAIKLFGIGKNSPKLGSSTEQPMKLTMGLIRNYSLRTTTSNMGLAMLGRSLSDSKKGLRRTRSKIWFFPVHGLLTQNSLEDPLTSVSNVTHSEWSGTELGCVHHPQEGAAGRPCFHQKGNFCRCFMEKGDTIHEFPLFYNPRNL